MECGCDTEKVLPTHLAPLGTEPLVAWSRNKEIEAQKGWMSLGMSTARNEKADSGGAKRLESGRKIPIECGKQEIKMQPIILAV